MKQQCMAKVEGRACKSPSVSQYGTKYYCMSHARKMNLVDDAEWREKAVRGTKRFNQARVAALAKITSASKMEYFLGMDHDAFDAGKEWPRIRAVNPMPGMVQGAEKYLVGLWLMANMDTRLPAKMIDLAEIVGVTLEAVEEWIRSKEILDIFDDANTRIMRSRRGLIDVILTNQCIAKDMVALKLYYQLYGDVQPVGRPKEPATLPIPVGGYERKETVTVSRVEKGTEPQPRLHSQAARVIAARLRAKVGPGTPTSESDGQGVSEEVDPFDKDGLGDRDADASVGNGGSCAASDEPKGRGLERSTLVPQAVFENKEGSMESQVGAPDPDGEELGTDEEEMAKVDAAIGDAFRDVIQAPERELPKPEEKKPNPPKGKKRAF